MPNIIRKRIPEMSVDTFEQKALRVREFVFLGDDFELPIAIKEAVLKKELHEGCTYDVLYTVDGITVEERDLVLDYANSKIVLVPKHESIRLGNNIITIIIKDNDEEIYLPPITLLVKSSTSNDIVENEPQIQTLVDLSRAIDKTSVSLEAVNKGLDEVTVKMDNADASISESIDKFDNDIIAGMTTINSYETRLLETESQVKTTDETLKSNEVSRTTQFDSLKTQMTNTNNNAVVSETARDTKFNELRGNMVTATNASITEEAKRTTTFNTLKNASETATMDSINAEKARKSTFTELQGNVNSTVNMTISEEGKRATTFNTMKTNVETMINTSETKVQDTIDKSKMEESNRANTFKTLKTDIETLNTTMTSNESGRIEAEELRESHFNAMKGEFDGLMEEPREAREDFYGVKHDNLKNRIDADVDYVHQRINNAEFVQYSDNHITANDTYYGLQRDMKIEGNTVQNLVVNDSNVETVVSGVMTSTEATSLKLDTVSGNVDVSIKGRTLQNLVKVGMFDGIDISSKWQNLSPTYYSFENGYIKLSASSLGQYVNAFDRIDSVLLKPDTDYTVIVDIKENSLSTETSYQACIVSTHSKSAFATNFEVNNGMVGIYRKKIRTKTNLTDLEAGLRTFIYNTIKGGSITYRYMVLEGDHTNTPLSELPYVEGIASVGDKSKNLFDNKGFVNGVINATTGVFTVGSTYVNNVITNYYTPVPSNTQLYWSSNGTVSQVDIYEYDNNYTFIKKNTVYTSNIAFTTSSTTKYIAIGMYKVPLSSSYVNSLNHQLEQGTTATPYEPIYEGYRVRAKSCGKNLTPRKAEYDNVVLNGLTLHSYDDKIYADGTLTNNADIGYFDRIGSDFNYVKLKPNTTYTVSMHIFSGTCTQYYPSVRLFDDNGNVKWVGTTFTTDNTLTKCNRIRVSSQGGSTFTKCVFSVQLEEGSKATPYTPYVDDTKTYYLSEPLRSLPNGVKDEIVGSTLIRRVGKVVLDDFSLLISQNTSVSGKMRWRITQNITIGNVLAGVRSTYCDKLVSITADNTWKANADGICQNNSANVLYLYLERYSDGSETSKQALINELRGATVYYELATPIVTELGEHLALQTFAETTHITSDNYLLPTLKVDSKGTAYETLLKPNTAYTVKWIAKDGGDNLDINLGGTTKSVSKTSGFTNVTTPSTLVDSKCRIGGWNTTVKDVMVVEGLVGSSDIYKYPYLQGIVSAGSLSKNLFKNIFAEELAKCSICTVYDNGEIMLDGTLSLHHMFHVTIPKGTYKPTEFLDGKTSLHVFWLNGDSGFDRAEITYTADTTVQCYIARGTYVKHMCKFQLEKDRKTATSYEPYYSGYKIDVKSIGKNLLDITKCDNLNATSYGITFTLNKEEKCLVLNGKNSGNYSQTPIKDITELFTRGRSYVLSTGSVGVSVRLTDFTGKHVYYRNNGKSFVFDNSIVQVVIFGSIEPTDTTTYNNTKSYIQIEESVTPTPYVEYLEDTKTYYLTEPLRSLYSGVKDEIIDGKLIRRVGSVVFDGSEVGGESIVDTINDALYLYCKMSIRNKCTNGSFCISDNFIGRTLWDQRVEGVKGISTGDFITFKILTSRLTSSNIEGFKSWLRDNPTPVYYELATPIVTDLNTHLALKSYEDVTHVTSDTLVLPKVTTKIPSNVNALLVRTMGENKTLSDENVNLTQELYAVNYNASATSAELSDVQNSVAAMSIENNELRTELENTTSELVATNLELKTTDDVLVKTTWEMDYRIYEIEWYLEDTVGVQSRSNFMMMRSGFDMSKFEQAKVIILSGDYDRSTLTRQLDMFVKRGVITQEEYDILISMMDAKEMIVG